MRFSTLRIIMLVWLCAWFGVILPGHERGVVQLPDFAGENHRCCGAVKQEIVAEPVHGCCQKEAATATETSPKESHAPAKPNPSKCAVCFTCFTLDVPVAIFFVSFFEREIDQLDAPAVQTLCSLNVIGITHPRGPPTLCIFC